MPMQDDACVSGFVTVSGQVPRFVRQPFAKQEFFLILLEYSRRCEYGLRVCKLLLQKCSDAMPAYRTRRTSDRAMSSTIRQGVLVFSFSRKTASVLCCEAAWVQTGQERGCAASFAPND